MVLDLHKLSNLDLFSDFKLWCVKVSKLRSQFDPRIRSLSTVYHGMNHTAPFRFWPVNLYPCSDSGPVNQQAPPRKHTSLTNMLPPHHPNISGMSEHIPVIFLRILDYPQVSNLNDPHTSKAHCFINPGATGRWPKCDLHLDHFLIFMPPSSLTPLLFQTNLSSKIITYSTRKYLTSSSILYISPSHSWNRINESVIFIKS